MRPHAALLPLLCSIGLVTPAGAGAVAGRVTVPPAPAVRHLHDYVGRASGMPAPARTPRGLVTDAVLYVEHVRPDAATDSVPSLAQRDQSFAPRVVVVETGGQVAFPNLDPLYHNVFSVSPIRRFDLGKYPRGQSRRVTFPRPGVVNVYCDIHADMSAFVVVLDGAAWTRPDADGRFALGELPPGTHVLHWWHPAFPGDSARVVVPESGALAKDVSF